MSDQPPAAKPGPANSKPARDDETKKEAEEQVADKAEVADEEQVSCRVSLRSPGLMAVSYVDPTSGAEYHGMLMMAANGPSACPGIIDEQQLQAWQATINREHKIRDAIQQGKNPRDVLASEASGSKRDQALSSDKLSASVCRQTTLLGQTDVLRFNAAGSERRLRPSFGNVLCAKCKHPINNKKDKFARRQDDRANSSSQQHSSSSNGAPHASSGGGPSRHERERDKQSVKSDAPSARLTTAQSQQQQQRQRNNTSYLPYKANYTKSRNRFERRREQQQEKQQQSALAQQRQQQRPPEKVKLHLLSARHQQANEKLTRALQQRRSLGSGGNAEAAAGQRNSPVTSVDGSHKNHQQQQQMLKVLRRLPVVAPSVERSPLPPPPPLRPSTTSTPPPPLSAGGLQPGAKKATVLVRTGKPLVFKTADGTSIGNSSSSGGGGGPTVDGNKPATSTVETSSSSSPAAVPPVAVAVTAPPPPLTPAPGTQSAAPKPSSSAALQPPAQQQQQRRPESPVIVTTTNADQKPLPRLTLSLSRSSGKNMLLKLSTPVSLQKTATTSSTAPWVRRGTPVAIAARPAPAALKILPRKRQASEQGGDALPIATGSAAKRRPTDGGDSSSDSDSESPPQPVEVPAFRTENPRSVTPTPEENPLGFKVRDIVWAKMPSEPYWPAKIYCFNSGGETCVLWLGSDQHGFIPCKTLEKFDAQFERRYNPKRPNNLGYQTAVVQAIQQHRAQTGSADLAYCLRKLQLNPRTYQLVTGNKPPSNKKKKAGSGRSSAGSGGNASVPRRRKSTTTTTTSPRVRQSLRRASAHEQDVSLDTPSSSSTAQPEEADVSIDQQQQPAEQSSLDDSTHNIDLSLETTVDEGEDDDQVPSTGQPDPDHTNGPGTSSGQQQQDTRCGDSAASSPDPGDSLVMDLNAAGGGGEPDEKSLDPIPVIQDREKSPEVVSDQEDTKKVTTTTSTTAADFDSLISDLQDFSQLDASSTTQLVGS